MLEKAREVTRRGRYQYVEYARFADDLVVLVDSQYGPPGLLGQVNRRLREEFAQLGVEVNEEKSRCVDLRKGESFGFLGFDFRRIRARNGKWRVQITPKLKKRTALLRKLKDVFRRYRSQPVGRVVEIINPILRGWVNYFAMGNASKCFRMVQRWVELKVRRHMMQTRKRRGFGWDRWSTRWLYEHLGLFNGYRLKRFTPKATPA
jgi:RNA-directed DNA polymerase